MDWIPFAICSKLTPESLNCRTLLYNLDANLRQRGHEILFSYKKVSSTVIDCCWGCNFCDMYVEAWSTLSKKEKQKRLWHFTFRLNCHGTCTCTIMKKNLQRWLINKVNVHHIQERSNTCTQSLTSITLVYNWSNQPAMSKNASLAKLSCKK